MTPKTNLHDKDEYTEFTIWSSVHSDPDKKGKQKLIKRNIITKISVYLDDIQGHEQVFDKMGKLLTGYCRLYHINMGPIVVKHSYKYVSTLKDKQHNEDTPKQIGFSKQPKKLISNYGKSK